MRGKTVKLIVEYARMKGMDVEEMKRWYEALNAPQREEAGKMMRSELALAVEGAKQA